MGAIDEDAFDRELLEMEAELQAQMALESPEGVRFSVLWVFGFRVLSQRRIRYSSDVISAMTEFMVRVSHWRMPFPLAIAAFEAGMHLRVIQ
jgi:hypothetical protein